MARIIKILFILYSCSSCALLLLIDEKNVNSDNTLNSKYAKTCSVQNYKIKKRSSPAHLLRKKKFNLAISNLNSNNDAIRTSSVTDLGYMGIYAKKSIPKLHEMAIHDKSKWVRRAAVKAISKIGSYRSIEILKKATKDIDPYVRASAQNSINFMNSRARLD